MIKILMTFYALMALALNDWLAIAVCSLTFFMLLVQLRVKKHDRDKL
jgi:hypothetical protein